MLLALSLDFLTQWSFWIVVGIFAGIYGLLALGLQLNVGYTGILNFGQAGFMAIGAYSAVILVVDVGLDYWAALPLSMLITVVAGLLVGLPAVRLRGDYLAIATIAFSEMVRITAKNARDLTGGNQGTLDVELDNNRYLRRSLGRCLALDHREHRRSDRADRAGLRQPAAACSSSWLTLGALAIVLTLLVRSPWGRVLRAIREDEDAARALGKNAFLYKLQSLANRRRARRDRWLVLGLPIGIGQPGVVRAAGHLPRLRGPRPRRPRELRRRPRRNDHLLVPSRGPARGRPRPRRQSDRLASIHRRGAGPDPA